MTVLDIIRKFKPLIYIVAIAFALFLLRRAK
jgi:hypothetical protein